MGRRDMTKPTGSFMNLFLTLDPLKPERDREIGRIAKE
jgi:hypothetical protein